MATLTKPSGYEVLPYHRKDGTLAWIWVCEQGCADSAPYDKTSREDTERAANHHVATVHG